MNRWRHVIVLAIVVTVLLLVCTHQNSVPLVPSGSGLSPPHVTSPSSDPTTPLLDNSDYTQRLPQAIIIGVRKGGTRALLDMLALHPSIVSAKAEVHFFDKKDNFQRGVQWYVNAMPSALPHHVVVEKTPAYFVGSIVPYRIYQTCPNVKLLLIVRNPVDRTISDYAQLNTKKRSLKHTRKHSSFEEIVFKNGRVNTNYSPISVSLYDEHFSIWLEYFKLSHILVVDGDALIQDPFTELHRAETFLGLNNYFTETMFYFNETKGFYCWHHHSNESHCLGSSKGREHPQVAQQSINKLKDFFKPHNEQFFSQTGLKFNW